MERNKKSIAQKMISKKRIKDLSDEHVEPGEEQLMRLSRVICEFPPNLKCPHLDGDIIMTNYKLVFRPLYQIDSKIHPPKMPLPVFMEDYMSVPLSYIHKCEKKIVEKKSGTQKLY